jgi:hypothetical protein
VRDDPQTKKTREDWESPALTDENYRFWKDHATAYEALKRLTSESPGSLRYTDFVDKIYKDLVARRPELDRLGRAEAMLRQAGIPRRNFHEDIESGVVTLTFNFEEWWPDEDRVPSDVANKLGWLEQAARKYWFPLFEGARPKIEKGDRESLYLRAKHQLLWFWHLVKDPAGPGALQSVRDDPQTKKTREDWESPALTDENYRFWKDHARTEVSSRSRCTIPSARTRTGASSSPSPGTRSGGPRMARPAIPSIPATSP